MYDIRLENVTKKFGDFTAVNDINFTIPKSSVTVLLGPSGCGKTTLMRMIAGLENPTQGKIFFGEHDVTNVPTRRRNIGMVFQYPVIYRNTSVRKNLELPLLSEKLSKQELDKRVDEVAEILGLTDVLKKFVEELDNGTRQKIAVGREVARQPRIILFDEPITNIDLTSKLELKRSLKELFGRLQQTIIYVTHDQTEAMTLADQIALMQDGVITQSDSPKEIYENPASQFAGWFLGNPGMNFVPPQFISVSGSKVSSKMFS
ncbi:MAG: ABC transporter ATP-binding protein, partial [Candidatus Nanopelagicales bacterium]